MELVPHPFRSAQLRRRFRIAEPGSPVRVLGALRVAVMVACILLVAARAPAAAAPMPGMPVFAEDWGCDGIPRAYGVATDRFGFVYVTDLVSDLVVKFDAQGNRVASWGGRGSAPGQLWGPHGITIHDDEVYVADNDNHRIQVFDLQGALLRTWGTYGLAPGSLRNPAHTFVHGDAVYVTDFQNHRVQVFGTDGTFRFGWGSPGSGPGQFGGPYGIVVTPQGDVFVADEANSRVQRFTATGEFVLQWTLVSREIVPRPRGLELDRDGRVFVCDYVNGRVLVYSPAGALLGQFGARGTGPGQFQAITEVAIDETGNLYAVENVCRIQRFVLDAATHAPRSTWGRLKARYR